MKITGIIRTSHARPDCVAAAITVDNLQNMVTSVKDGMVETVISGEQMRSIIASVDDYLTNITVADEVCR